MNKENKTITYMNKILLKYGGLIILFALLKGVFMYFMRQTIIVMSRKIEYDLKNEIYKQYQSLSIAFYKNNKTTTDVLTFTSYQKDSNNDWIRFCNIAISGSAIKSDSKRLKINFYDHLSHIIIHALLHSNNYTHYVDKDFEKMKSIEIIILKKLNIKNPYNL